MNVKTQFTEAQIAQVLRSEAVWLEESHKNSLLLGYPKAQTDGYADAASWVRFHANNPHLVIARDEIH